MIVTECPAGATHHEAPGEVEGTGKRPWTPSAARAASRTRPRRSSAGPAAPTSGGRTARLESYPAGDRPAPVIVPPSDDPPPPPGCRREPRDPFETGIDDEDLTVPVEGTPVTLTVNVTNTSSVVDGYVVEGLNAPPWLGVRPGTWSRCRVLLAPWRRSCGSCRPPWCPPRSWSCCQAPQHHRQVRLPRHVRAAHRAGRRGAAAGARRASADPRARPRRGRVHGRRGEPPEQPVGPGAALRRPTPSRRSGRAGASRSSTSPGRRGEDRRAVRRPTARPGWRGQPHDHDHRGRGTAACGDDGDAHAVRVPRGDGNWCRSASTRPCCGWADGTADR